MKNETVNNTTNNNTTMDSASMLSIISKYDSMSKESREELKASLMEEITAKEAGAKARVDTFSDEKGKALNQQYGDYIEGSIKENFAEKVGIHNEKMSLAEQEQSIQLAKREAEAQMKIDRMMFDANLELEKKKSESSAYTKGKFHHWVWRIFWPVLGAGAGVLAFYLLYILK